MTSDFLFMSVFVLFFFLAIGLWLWVWHNRLDKVLNEVKSDDNKEDKQAQIYRNRQRKKA